MHAQAARKPDADDVEPGPLELTEFLPEGGLTWAGDVPFDRRPKWRTALRVGADALLETAPAPTQELFGSTPPDTRSAMSALNNTGRSRWVYEPRLVNCPRLLPVADVSGRHDAGIREISRPSRGTSHRIGRTPHGKTVAAHTHTDRCSRYPCVGRLHWAPPSFA